MWCAVGLAVAAVLAVITLGIGLVMALGRPPGVAPNHAAGGGAPAATIKTVSPERAVRILPDGTAAINPTTPIVIRAVMGTLRSVTVVNAANGTVVRGESFQDRTTWTSTEPLGYSSTYRIDATATAGNGVPVWIAKADGATKTMQIFDNDQLVSTMPISLGSPGFPTHNGPHVISDRQPSIIMDPCTGSTTTSASATSSRSPTPADIHVPVWDTYGDWTLAWPHGKPAVLSTSALN